MRGLIYPGCEFDEQCVAAALAPDCGCSEFSELEVAAREAEAATIVVDVPASHTYAAALQSADAKLETGCVVEIDCDAFADCVLDPETVGVPALARAVINHPGQAASPDAGIRVDLRTGACGLIEHAEQPGDWLAGPAAELRGDLRLCSGCL